jgi:hypothetical protein
MPREPTEAELVKMPEKKLIKHWQEKMAEALAILEELRLDIPVPKFNEPYLRAELGSVVEQLKYIEAELKVSAQEVRRENGKRRRSRGSAGSDSKKA